MKRFLFHDSNLSLSFFKVSLSASLLANGFHNKLNIFSSDKHDNCDNTRKTHVALLIKVFGCHYLTRMTGLCRGNATFPDKETSSIHRSFVRFILPFISRDPRRASKFRAPRGGKLLLYRSSGTLNRGLSTNFAEPKDCPGLGRETLRDAPSDWTVD